jgi:hypothetical protein
MSRLKFQEMLEGLRQDLEGVPEHRSGRNIQYEIADAGLGAFSVFYAIAVVFGASARHATEKGTEQCARPVWSRADTE